MVPSSARLRVLRAGFKALGPVAPALAAEFAERLFCTPPHRDLSDDEAAFLATGARFEVRTEKDVLAAWRWGTDGPLALLLHGWGSRAARWHELTPALVADGFQVVAFDQAAHGDSSGHQASLPQFVHALESVIAQLGVSPALLVGHSLGGSALAMAMHRGAAPRRAVLLSAPSEQREYADLFARTFALPDDARAIMDNNLSERLGFTWEDLDIPTFASTFTVPALIVHDRADPDVSFSHAERLTKSWLGAALLETSGLGHGGALDDAAVLRRIRDFAAGAR